MPINPEAVSLSKAIEKTKAAIEHDLLLGAEKGHLALAYTICFFDPTLPGDSDSAYFYTIRLSSPANDLSPAEQQRLKDNLSFIMDAVSRLYGRKTKEEVELEREFADLHKEVKWDQ